MDILQILGFAIATVVLIKIIKEYSAEFSTIIAIIFGVVFFIYISSNVVNIFEHIRNICNYVGINIIYIEVMFKVVGISYMCEFISAVCKDAGESSIAVKVDIAGKLIILLSSMPIFEELINVIIKVAT